MAAVSRKVCVAIDESEYSAQALKWALKGVVRPNDEVHLVHVQRPVPASTSVTGDPETGYNLQATPWVSPPPTADASNALEAAKEEARSLGVPNVKVEHVVGSVGGAEGVGLALKDYVVQNNVDTMVVGSRGLGSISRTLLGVVGLGSVSDFCVRHVPCPVVVHKAAPAAPLKANGVGNGAASEGVLPGPVYSA